MEDKLTAKDNEVASNPTSDVEASPAVIPNTPPQGGEQHPDNAASQHLAKPAARPPRKLSPIIVASVIFLCVGLLVINIILLHQATPEKKVVAPKVTTIPIQTITTKDANLLHFHSSNFNYSFDYPIDWRLEHVLEDSQVTVTSPVSKMTDGSMQAITYKIIEPYSAAGSFDGVYDDSIITADSETLTYAHPVKGQRKTTHISFVGGQAASAFPENTITAAFISSGFIYKKGDVVSSQDYKSVNPYQVISGYFTLEDWHTNPTFEKIRQIIESLQIP